MDIARPDIKRKKVRRQIITGIIALVVVAAAAAAVMRLKPAAPTVDANTIWSDTVKRGPLVVQVRGLGTLVPSEESIRLVPAQTESTVVRIRVLPGTRVKADTVIMELADPQLDQELLNAELQLKSDQVAYHNLQAQLQSALMDKKVAAATVSSNYQQAQMQAQIDKQRYELGVISGIDYNKSKTTADALTTQNRISEEQIDINEKAIKTQLDVQEAKIEQDKALLQLKQSQKAALQVRAGIDGVLTSLGPPVTSTSDQSSFGVGTHVAPGTTLATVVVPNQLKAQLKIAETQAHDILLDQPAEIDTHNGVVPGHVTRIDPAVVNGTRTVDVKLDGPLPPGAVPQLSVDGTIDQQRLSDVLYVGRPAFGNPDSTISLFRIDPDGKTATRVQVKVGKASVDKIQVLDGLKEGDRVILSDMSRYDATDKVRLE
ncbi:efflux RND transporter periplasmic adaptor subunit [Pseudacidobacterium ailaaui]|jgi:multidrug efflux pump subunit AcrA (membrane-fusion protein)|uniref:efflux RND transporter periplasmic adaptor subunit n=1 Tax=Pseudacidobacterium ailaaui TaxID=1382359 RepID=UPI000478701F|nr:HlyD family efflux transporter periplasmic adaptor subunit [Pseudacidobacterium ailaaui]MBX6358795.1 efflux RND transporter periplasmic adaptor subunit [Pseudacidobacterium ailaaui]MCL6464493.1 HlyD family efflux transporter periplasmic adaptor subunit [Pseudacidobacterium ailaaui]MDI3253918.1 HlyD family efflux transporter periplasmic adaptor subunit [Bacillota bacterium]